MTKLYSPGPRFDREGEFPVYLNTSSPDGAYGVIDFGPETFMHVEPADAEKMIRALAKVAAFGRAYRQPHPFEPAEDGYGCIRCARCGTGRHEKVHDGPAPDDAQDPDPDDERCPRCKAVNWGMTPDGRLECVSCQWTAPQAVPA